VDRILAPDPPPDDGEQDSHYHQREHHPPHREAHAAYSWSFIQAGALW
jgi:hypothetical protein